MEVNRFKTDVDKRLSSVGKDVGGLGGLKKSIKDAYAPLFAPIKKVQSLVVRPKIETQEYKKNEQQLLKATADANKYKAALAKTPTEVFSDAFKADQKELARLQKEYDATEVRIEKMRNAKGRAYSSEKLDAEIAKLQKLDSVMGKVNARMEKSEALGTARVANPNYEQAYARWSNAEFRKSTLANKRDSMIADGSRYEKTTTIFSRLKKALDNVTKSFKKAHKANGDMSKGMRSTLGAGGALSRMFRTLAISARFMIASMIFRGALDAMKQGFTDLAAYSQQTRASLTMLKSSLIQLRGSFASAFAPILTAVAPVLNYLIQLLADAMTAIAKFFAYLTGQKTVTVAIPATREFKATGDEADSANDKAKELQKTLMGFDQINKLNDATSSSSASGNGLDEGSVFQTIDTGANDFAQMVKDAWAKADFTNVGYTVADKLADALEKIPWDKIKETAFKIGKSIATFINGACENLRFWEDLGNTIAQGLNTAINFAYAFVKYLDVHAVAEAIATGINAALTNIEYDKLAYSIVTFISKAITLVIEILANLDYLAIGKALVEGIGKGIKDAIQDDPSNILGVAILAAVLTSKIRKIAKSIRTILFGATKGAELAAPELSSGWVGLVPKIKDIVETGYLVVLEYGPLIANAILAAIPVAGVVALCATAIAAVVGMVEHWGETVQGFKKNDPTKYFETYGQSLHEMSGYADSGITGFAATVNRYLGPNGEVNQSLAVASGTNGSIVENIKTAWTDATTTVASAFDAIKQKTKDVPITMQEMSGSNGSIVENIKTAWTDAATTISSKWEAIKASLRTGSENNIQVRVGLIKSGWSTLSSWVGNHVDVGVSLLKRGWASITSWVGNKVSVGISLLKKGWTSLKTWLGLDQVFKLKLSLPHIRVNWGSTSIGGVTLNYPTGFSTYAKGGFPEEGPFFMNRGEIAGKFSNGKGVVANNQQITDGIAQAVGPAVYEAMVSALANMDNSGNVTVVLEGDAKKLFKAVQTEANNYTRATGQLAFNM